ncbi:MAG: mechanosensitive ion channel family protein [Anaerolineaceae bacterium]
MSFITQLFYQNPIENWLIALLTALIAFLILMGVGKILISQLRKYVIKSNAPLNGVFVSVVQSTKKFFLVVTSIFIASQTLNLSIKVQDFIQIIFQVILILQIGFWIDSFVTEYAKIKSNDSSNKTALNSLGVIVRLIVWVIVILLALDNLPNVKITSLITSLGIAGIAVGLAVQKILEDLFASMSISLDQPFQIGDTIDIDGIVGTIEHIGLKSTRIRALTGEQIIMSNSNLLDLPIHNLQRMENRLVAMNLSITYQVKPETLRRIPEMIKEIVEQEEEVRFERAHFKNFGDSGLMIEVIYWIESADYAVYMDKKQNVNLKIFEKFSQEGIEFAYPTQTVFIEKTS